MEVSIVRRRFTMVGIIDRIIMVVAGGVEVVIFGPVSLVEWLVA